MRRFPVCTLAGTALAVANVALAVPPSNPPSQSVTWTHEYNFDNAPANWPEWTITNCVGCAANTARWINPAAEASGPALPDGAASGSSGILGNAAGGGGGGSLYLPGDNAGQSGSLESRASVNIADLLGVNTTSAFVMQVDVYIPNLLPLSSGNWQSRPGNDIQSAGFCLERGDGDSVCLEGASQSSGPQGYVRFRDFTGSAGNTWQYPVVGINPVKTTEELWLNLNCSTPANPTQWWDDWVTLRVDYNFTVPGSYFAWIYRPWTSPNPNCGFAATLDPGWVQVATGAIGFNGPESWTKVVVGGAYSWTQAQFDNVKLALPSQCSDPYADFDEDGDADQTDFGIWQFCYTGANNSSQFDPLECSCVDRDGDTDVDEVDLASFLACVSGPNIPANPSCD